MALRAVLLLAILFAFGCATASTTAPPIGKSATTPAAPRSPTTIESVETQSGRVDIVDDGKGGRSLVVGRVVRRRTAQDPMADLVFHLVPDPRRVLLLGIGTGQLAIELSRRGVEVDVLEPDAALARAVCTHLGCAGHIVIESAPWHVVGGYTRNAEVPQLGPNAATSSVWYDAVIVDEEVSRYPMGAVANVGDVKGVRLAPAALLASRSRRESSPPPSEADSDSLLRLIGQREDGIYDEIQLGHGMASRLDGAGLRVWPSQQTIDVLPAQSGAEKNIRAFGYLVQTKSGDLA
ncbi:MAG: hypothetical protein K0S65_3772, partial [Labilithrix sp.]|nr:hypothetical protein [Labilithrix sp.]